MQPEKLIEILKNSKNLLRFQDDFVEMQTIDRKGREYFVKLDYESVEKLSKTRWRAELKTEDYVAITGRVNNKTIIQSRIILGVLSGKFCDHINGDPTDNRIKNLRAASHTENMRNRKTTKGNKYKGIYFFKKNSKWRAQISINGKVIHLGMHLTDRQAAIAYNNAATEHYGEFARLNIIN